MKNKKYKQRGLVGRVKKYYTNWTKHNFKKNKKTKK